MTYETKEIFNDSNVCICVQYYTDGKNYRENGPSIEFNDGTKVWTDINEEYHREGAPAIEYGHGAKRWYKHGKLHCETGPAVDCPKVSLQEYYLEGKKLTKEEFEKCQMQLKQ